MSMPFRVSDLPLRLITGAFILNSGLNKRGADEEAAAGMHGMAANAYPFLGKVDPVTFVKVLSASEIALGAALMLPVVPSRLAGAGLTAFGGALTGLYLRTPGMHEEGGVRPTEEGTGLAKDSWLLGAGLSLVLSGCAQEWKHQLKQRRRKMRKQAH
ncbi:hypothetical protein [Nocardiopsis algeriensis]|uniref:DoxX family membrane protein n=1 Tax=Nocardiopsis algeriensis TaxID=1478215 RepID=A0A841ILL2_9ACTN|nr:hypothetical protein [Nocardiopsis algeriensis]MBB6119699.1 hypothetical protein [Nocardiopsis algeriensis]